MYELKSILFFSPQEYTLKYNKHQPSKQKSNQKQKQKQQQTIAECAVKLLMLPQATMEK